MLALLLISDWLEPILIHQIFEEESPSNNTSLRFLVICLADKISVQCYCYFCHSQIQRIMFWTDEPQFPIHCRSLLKYLIVFGLPLELVQEELGRLPKVSDLLEYLIGSGSL